MWQLAPIFRTLMRRKFGVFLLVIQIAFTTAIFSNLAFLMQQVNLIVMQPSGVADKQLFATTVRPVNTLINYADAERDIRDLETLPNVERVAAMRWVPLAGLAEPGAFRVNVDKESASTTVATVDVSYQTLSTLGLRLIAGRDFTAEDMRIKTSTDAPEPKNIIITHILAEALFGKDQNAIGKLVYDGDVAREIIGVTENWLGFTLPFNDRAEKTVFIPRYDETITEHRYLVRAKTPQDRAAVVESVNQLLLKNYQHEVLLWVEKIDEDKTNMLSSSVVLSNLFLVIIVTMGFVVAFAISGQTLFWITQRTKQIGVRRALGASRMAIVVQLLVENAMISTLGLGVGIVLSLLVNQVVMQAAGTVPMSPLFLLATCIALLVVCLVSAAVPSWSASKISPSMATRSV